MKRTALKRTAALQSDPQKTREWQQKRPAGLKRTTHLKPRSAKRAALEKLYSIARGNYLKAHPICQWPGCHSRAVDVHHSRGRDGALYLDATWFRALCRACHERAHREPLAAKAAGVSFVRGSVIEE